jgi:multidrug transporter EmrE-like cation transporter
MPDISHIFREFLQWLPNWQIGVVLALLFALAIMRKIRIMLFVGFIIAFLWGIAFFRLNEDMLALLGGVYYAVFVATGVFIILAMSYLFFFRPR